MGFKKNSSLFFSKICSVIVMFLVLLVSFSFYVHSEKQIDRANHMPGRGRAAHLGIKAGQSQGCTGGIDESG